MPKVAFDIGAVEKQLNALAKNRITPAIELIPAPR